MSRFRHLFMAALIVIAASEMATAAGVFVANNTGNSVTGYPTNGSGNISPSINITGSNTRLFTPQGETTDSYGDIFVVTCPSAQVSACNGHYYTLPGAIEEFCGPSNGSCTPANGNATPIGEIWGQTNDACTAANTAVVGGVTYTWSCCTGCGTGTCTNNPNLVCGDGIRINGGTLWATDNGNSNIEGFTLPLPVAGSGNIPPNYGIHQASGGLITDVLFDSGNRMYTADAGFNTISMYLVSTYQRAYASPLPTPSPDCKLTNAAPSGSIVDLGIDTSDDIYLTDLSNLAVDEYPHSSFVSSPCPATGATITATPSAQIIGSHTQLSYPRGIALDSSNNIYVSNSSSILAFPAGSNGNATPVPTPVISGTNTELSQSDGVAFAPLLAPSPTSSATPTATTTPTPTTTTTPSPTSTPTATTSATPTPCGAVTLRSCVSGTVAAVGNQVTVPFTGDQQNGDMIVMGLLNPQSSNGTIAAPSGYTEWGPCAASYGGSGTPPKTCVTELTHIYGVGDSAPKFTIGPATSITAVYVSCTYTGTSGIDNGSETSSNSTSSSISTGAGVHTIANYEMSVPVYGAMNSSVTLTLPAGYTQEGNQAYAPYNEQIWLADKGLGLAGTSTGTLTGTTSGNVASNGGAQIALIPQCMATPTVTTTSTTTATPTATMTSTTTTTATTSSTPTTSATTTSTPTATPTSTPGCPLSIISISPLATSCWPVYENSGTTIYDTIDSNDGTISGSYTYEGGTPGNPNGAYCTPNFQVGCNISTPLNYSTASPFSFIVKFAGTSGGILQFGQPTNPSTQGGSPEYYLLFLDNYGHLTFGQNNYGMQIVLQSPLTYADGNAHIAMFTSGSAGMRLYVDGMLVAKNGTTLANYAAGGWFFGGINPANWQLGQGNSYFSGTLYYMAWWNGTQLSDSVAEAATWQ